MRLREQIVALTAVLSAGVPAMAESRCGWLDNPTPANYWLTDADGAWTLMVQGGAIENGFIDLPAEQFDFADEWEYRNVGSYGFGCACIEGDFGPVGSGEVVQVREMRPLPLAKCRADPALPER